MFFLSHTHFSCFWSPYKLKYCNDLLEGSTSSCSSECLRGNGTTSYSKWVHYFCEILIESRLLLHTYNLKISNNGLCIQYPSSSSHGRSKNPSQPHAPVYFSCYHTAFHTLYPVSKNEFLKLYCLLQYPVNVSCSASAAPTSSKTSCELPCFRNSAARDASFPLGQLYVSFPTSLASLITACNRSQHWRPLLPYFS
jgi:hypothetical protein